MKKNYVRFIAVIAITGMVSTSAFGQFGGFRRGKIPEKPVISMFDDGTAPQKPNDPGIVVQLGSGQFPDLGSYNFYYRQTLRELQSILNRVVAAGPRPDAKAKVRIYASGEPNAFALGNGLIVISTGMLDALTENAKGGTRDDAMAFIMAHEYAHLLLYHPEYRQLKEKSVERPGQILAGAGLIAGVARAQVAQRSGDYAKSRKGQNQAAYTMLGAVLAGEWLKAELYRFSFGGYARAKELEADFLANDMLRRFDYYDPLVGSAPLVEIFGPYDASFKGYLKKQLDDVTNTVKTATTAFVAAAPQAMLSNRSFDIGNDAKRYFVRVGIGVGIQKLRERFNRKDVHLHHSADRRVALIKKYNEEFYPDAKVDRPDANRSVWSSVYGVESKELDAANKVRAHLALGEIEEARAVLNTVLTPSANHLYELLIAAANVASAEGKPAEAIRRYEQAITKESASPLAYKSLALVHLSRGNKDKALNALERGEKRFGGRRYFIAAMISVYEAHNDRGSVEALLEECRAFGEDVLTRECENAAGDLGKPEGSGFLENLGDRVGEIGEKIEETATDIVR